MYRKSHCLFLITVLSIVASSSTKAENWPGWRGPRGDGTSLETGLPTKWSAADGKMENIVWKTPIPGLGHSSPIVWNDRIFLTTALGQGHDRALVCVDRKSGKILWQKTVVNAPLEAKQGENSYASSTPITDGKSVFVTFLDGKEVVVAAYDCAGKQQWIARPGAFDSMWGFCHSPVLFEDKVLVACCGKTAGFIAALKQADGKTAWNRPATGRAKF